MWCMRCMGRGSGRRKWRNVFRSSVRGVETPLTATAAAQAHQTDLPESLGGEQPTRWEVWAKGGVAQPCSRLWLRRTHPGPDGGYGTPTGLNGVLGRWEGGQGCQFVGTGEARSVGGGGGRDVLARLTTTGGPEEGGYPSGDPLPPVPLF